MARMAAFDMDGTLLMPDHRLGEKTLSTLKRLRDRDITLTFAPVVMLWKCATLSASSLWMRF